MLPLLSPLRRRLGLALLVPVAVLVTVLVAVGAAAAQTPFEAWNYLDLQHRAGEGTWLHATAKLKWRNRGEPGWFYYGGEVGVQQALWRGLHGGVNYILLRTSPGTRFYRDQRVDVDGEAYLPRGFRDRVRYEYRWFLPATGGVWRDRLLWSSPAERGGLRPEGSFEIYYDPRLGRTTDQRYALGGTLTRLPVPLELVYAYDRYWLGGWRRRNLLSTTVHLGR